MKKFYSISMLIVIVLSLCSSIMFAGNIPHQTIPLKKQKREHNQQLDPEGVRIPPRNIICTIGADGVWSEIAEEDIISYEIWDSSNSSCIAAYTEELPFCEYLFGIPGEYNIRILTDFYAFMGHISTWY